MKIRNLILFALALFVSTAALAQTRTTRTVVIRDGKLIENGDILLDTDLFGPRTYLGVTLVEMSSELRKHFGAPGDAGVLVSSVDETSPAGKAGIRVGDILLSLDGEDIDSPAALRRGLGEKKDGDSVRVDLLRGKARQTVIASVVEREGAPLGIPGVRALRTLRPRNDAEWRAQVFPLTDCGDLSARIKDLETKLKALESKIR